MYEINFVTHLKHVRKHKCIVQSSAFLVRVTVSHLTQRVTMVSFRIWRWEGTVIQFRNSKQRLEAAPFTEPHDMLHFLQCSSMEYQQLGRDRTISWTYDPHDQYFLYKILCNQTTLNVYNDAKEISDLEKTEWTVS